MLQKIPYTDVSDPDYMELLTVSDLDPLLDLYGHLSAANPANQVNLRIAGKLTADDYTSHLVSLRGGLEHDYQHCAESPFAAGPADEHTGTPQASCISWPPKKGQRPSTGRK